MASLTATPRVTYTPNGAARAPGYYDPSNPYDTGYSGLRNAELNSGQKTTYANWDYGAGAPSGASLDPNTGLYQLAGSPGGGGGGGGSNPAFGPQFDQMMADLRAQGVADKASRDAAIKRSFINFGLNNFDLNKAAQTTGIGDLASILDPQTMDVAKNNKFSVLARLQQALQDQQRSNRISLRQRGGVRSGESGFLAQRAQTGFDTNVYDSTQKLLDYISGAQQGYAQAEQARKMALWQAALAAAQGGGGWGYGGGGGGGDYAQPQATDPQYPAWQPGEIQQLSKDTGFSIGKLARGRGGQGWDWA